MSYFTVEGTGTEFESLEGVWRYNLGLPTPGNVVAYGEFTRHFPVKEGFKITDQCLRSYVGNMVYALGVPAFPKEGCGPLCVFDNMPDADRFRLSEEGWRVNKIFRVFKCRYARSLDCAVWLGKRAQRAACYLPDGTDLATWVELVEEIT